MKKTKRRKASKRQVKKLPVFVATQDNLEMLPYLRGCEIHAFKYVTKSGCSPYFAGPLYKVGKSYNVRKINMAKHSGCGQGLNVATRDWCISDSRTNYSNCHGHSVYKWYLLKVAIKAGTQMCIPSDSGGKFRVKAFKVLSMVKI